MARLTLDVLDGELAVCRLPGEAPPTDYVVVRDRDLTTATQALAAAGHVVA